MSGRLILHIGPHKTATSSIQSWLTHEVAALAGVGAQIARSGRDDLGHHRLASSLLEERPANEPAGGVVATAPWMALRRELDELDQGSTLIVSSENLSQLGDDDVGRVRAVVGDARVTVVVGVRDPVGLVPSLWQETVKWGRQWSLPAAARELFAADGVALIPLLDRWGALNRNTDVVAFVVPGQRRDRSALDHFAVAIGVPRDIVDDPPAGSNASLSFAHVEAIRAVSRTMDPDEHDATLASRQSLTLELARQIDIDPWGARPALPRELGDAATGARRRLLDQLAARRVRLVGDPTEIEAPVVEYSPPTPADVVAVLEQLRERLTTSDDRRHLDDAVRAVAAGRRQRPRLARLRRRGGADGRSSR